MCNLKYIFVITLALGATAVFPVAAAASSTHTSVPQIDTQISEKAATTNYGGGTSISVGGDEPSGSGKDIYALLRFDLSSIPAGSTIESATLKLNITNPSVNTYQAYALTRAWVENQATWR